MYWFFRFWIFSGQWIAYKGKRQWSSLHNCMRYKEKRNLALFHRSWKTSNKCMYLHVVSFMRKNKQMYIIFRSFHFRFQVNSHSKKHLICSSKCIKFLIWHVTHSWILLNIIFSVSMTRKTNQPHEWRKFFPRLMMIKIRNN